MWIIAHRGLHDVRTENSLGAVETAVAAGIDRIEVDVRLTADGVPVLLHDARLDRTTTASGVLAAHTFADLDEVTLADGSPVPRLDDVLRLGARAEAQLCLDVKEAEAGDAVIAAVRRGGAAVEIWSAHREVVARATDARLPAALITSGLLPAGGLPELVDEARQLGAFVLPRRCRRGGCARPARGPAGTDAGHAERSADVGAARTARGAHRDHGPAARVRDLARGRRTPRAPQLTLAPSATGGRSRA